MVASVATRGVETLPGLHYRGSLLTPIEFSLKPAWLPFRGGNEILDDHNVKDIVHSLGHGFHIHKGGTSPEKPRYEQGANRRGLRLTAGNQHSEGQRRRR